MRTETTQIQRIVLVRMNPGDDILLSLREAVKRENIRNAVILNGVGSVASIHYHVVTSIKLPPENGFPKKEGPFDIVSYSGMVINGRVHAHILFSDEEKAEGGHLEEGCRVLTFSAVMIADLGDTNITDWDEYTGRLTFN